MSLTTLLRKREEEFDEYFYEGEDNSTWCYKHKLYSTPVEHKRFNRETSRLLLEEVKKEVQYKKQMWVKGIERAELANEYNEALDDVLTLLNEALEDNKE